MNRRLSVAAVSLLLTAGGFLLAGLAGCSDTAATTAGYWEGKGTATERPMDDAVRKLTRGAEYEFWFTVDENGDAVGEIALTYSADLKVEGSPKATAAAPGGNISFKPEVGGTLTDLDPSRRFPIVGILKKGQLALAIATPEAARPPLEFTIRADAGLSGGMAISGGSVDGLPALGKAQVSVHKMDMVPFSPFGDAVEVEKRSGGPFAASYKARGDNYAIDWTVRQMGGEQRAAELTPELETALRELRENLKD